MEQCIQLLIYIHAFLGGIGLLTGILIVTFKKGGKIHKVLGNVFTISIILSVVLSLIIASLPNHKNTFLFLIGVFTIYLVIVGNRALKFKTETQDNVLDKIISGIMLLCALVMIILGSLGLMQKANGALLFLIFGGFGCFLSLMDFRFYKNPKRYKNGWLMAHVGKMLGAFIASVTAFIVAGVGIGSTLAWIMPTLLGTPYIIYWIKKLKPAT